MKIDTAYKKSLQEMLSGISSNSITKYLNSNINIASLGENIFDSKMALNLFDMNRVSKKERYLRKVQNTYFEELLKASTPNFKIDSKTFHFNTENRIGWIILEFNVERNISAKKNIDYLKEYITSKINTEPTFIAIQNKLIFVGFFFPNYPTTNDKYRLKKYRYFKDVRIALTHFLEANWLVTVDNYNEVKEYENILNSQFKLYGNIFEIGVFQEMLDEYKQTSICKKVIKEKLSYGGTKSADNKRKMTLAKRKLLVEAANEKKIHMSKCRLEDTMKYILDTEINPKFTIDNIVKTSREVFYGKGLGHKTVAKYLKEIKSDLGIE